MKRSVASREEFVSSEAPRTVSEAVYQRLRQDIIWGTLPPDAALRSDELRANYDVGISPLREALSRLVAERLVTTVGQRGFRVAPLTAADVMDVAQARLVIEKDSLVRSIQNGDIGWEREIVASYHTLSRNPFPAAIGPALQQWVGFHRQFHVALIAACGSRWQLEIASQLFDQAERHRAVRAKIVPKPKLKRDVAAEHEEIYEATLARDAKAAVAALERHYEATTKQVLVALQHSPKLKPSK
jgi:DNA-binding GntR family transcriptional regulator